MGSSSVGIKDFDNSDRLTVQVHQLNSIVVLIKPEALSMIDLLHRI